MNPDKRFGQIEELVAEIVQKQDEHTAQIGQLARTVGQVLEVAVEAKDAAQTSLSVATEAKGIALESLAVATESRDIATESRGIAIQSRDIAIESRDIARRAEHKADIIANAVANLTTDMQKGFSQVNGRFDELMSFLKQKLD